MLDFFSILGLTRNLSIKLPVLEERFRESSLKFHPDRVASDSPAERAVAIKQSSLINEAYRTLKDPWARANYAVEKFSGLVPKDSPPTTLLEELMEIQETTMELQEAKLDNDSLKIDALQQKLHQVHGTLKTEQDTFELKREQLFQKFDSGDESALSKLSALLGERKYLTRIIQSIENTIL